MAVLPAASEAARGDRLRPAARRLVELLLLDGHEVALAGQVEAVVHERVRRELVHQVEQPAALPRVAPLAGEAAVGAARVGEVEPEDVDLSVLRQELGHLVAHELRVLADVALPVQVRRVLAVAQGVEDVDRVLRVVPVLERVVEADAEPLGAEGVDDRAEQVAARGRVRRLEFRELRIPEAEAVVVLGGHDEVLHPRLAGEARPGARVELVRVEALRVAVVDLVGDLLRRADPLVLGGHRVEAPVHEEAEAGLLEPGDAVFEADGRRSGGGHGGAGYMRKSSVRYSLRTTGSETISSTLPSLMTVPSMRM